MRRRVPEPDAFVHVLIDTRTWRHMYIYQPGHFIQVVLVCRVYLHTVSPQLVLVLVDDVFGPDRTLLSSMRNENANAEFHVVHCYS